MTLRARRATRTSASAPGKSQAPGTKFATADHAARLGAARSKGQAPKPIGRPPEAAEIAVARGIGQSDLTVTVSGTLQICRPGTLLRDVRNVDLTGRLPVISGVRATLRPLNNAKALGRAAGLVSARNWPAGCVIWQRWDGK